MDNQMCTIARLNLMLAGLIDEFGDSATENLLKNYPALRSIAAGTYDLFPHFPLLHQEENSIINYPSNYDFKIINQTAGKVTINNLVFNNLLGVMLIVLWYNFDRLVTYDQLFKFLYPNEPKLTHDTHRIRSLASRLNIKLKKIDLELFNKPGTGYILSLASSRE